MEKFLHRGSVERVLHRGSKEDYTDLLLGIKHHNNSYAKEVWKGSYTMEAQKIGLIRYWVSSTIIDSYAMVVWRSSYIVKVWKRSYTMEA